MFPGIQLDRKKIKKKKIRRTSKPSLPATVAEMGNHDQILQGLEWKGLSPFQEMVTKPFCQEAFLEATVSPFWGL